MNPMYQVTLGLVEHLPEEAQQRITMVILAEAAKAVVPVSFRVVIRGYGQNKIGAIKAVRNATNLGLKEAKDLVELSDAGPAVIFKNLSETGAIQALKKLREQGVGDFALEPA